MTGGGSIDNDAPGFQPGEESVNLIPPLQLRVEPVEFSHVSPFVREYHYLAANPSFRKQSFAVFHQWTCVGVAVWGTQSGGHGADPGIWELKRMWISDQCGKNSESRVLGYMARWIRKNRPEVFMLLSYSDESMGHKGTIYQASGWERDAYLPPSAPWHGGPATKVNGWKTRWKLWLKPKPVPVSFLDDE